MVSRKVSRRRFVASTAAMSTARVAAPFVRGAYAAGKLSVGFWDHWVPNANGATEKLIKEWAEKEKVDVQIDFITSQGNKLLLTTAAEAQAKSGHDILAHEHLPAGALCRAARADERPDGPADQGKRQGQRHRRVSRQGRRQVAGRPRDRRQPDQGPVLAHRLHEAVCRHRRPGDVSGGRRRPRPTTGPSTPSSRPRRPATRAAIRSASGSARRRTTSTRSARSSTLSAR